MKEIISSGLAELGLADRVPEHAPEQLAEYGRLMLEKNQVMNLTAWTAPPCSTGETLRARRCLTWAPAPVCPACR